MTLKAVLDTLEGVEDHFHGLYTERNGKFELTGIEGVKTQADVDRLQTALNKERNDHKGLREKYAPLAAFDTADILDRYNRHEELLAASEGKLDDTKINGIVESRIRSKLGPVERERDTLKAQLAERDQIILGYQTKETQRAISDKVREAATGAKILPEAFDDALLLAERVFELAEDGRVVTKDNVGVTPGIDPSVWFTELQTKRPHWWGPSVGGGGRGSQTPGGSTNPWSNENWNLTEQGKILTANRSRAEQLAKAAGTSIGGPRPQGRK